MIATVSRRKIEILVDRPLVRKVVSLADAHAIRHYTLLPVLGGAGSAGAWSDDQLSGADAKIMFVAITSEQKSSTFIEAISPLLESHGLILTISHVDVVRGDKF